jgi:hypothetical protein
MIGMHISLEILHTYTLSVSLYTLLHVFLHIHMYVYVHMWIYVYRYACILASVIIGIAKPLFIIPCIAKLYLWLYDSE